MPRTTTPTAAPVTGPRRRGPTRRLDPFGVVPTEQTAAAIDDVAEIEALFDDLLALLDAGLIAAAEQHGSIRYTALDQDEGDAGVSEPVTVGTVAIASRER